jgi:hypothetical protein
MATRGLVRSSWRAKIPPLDAPPDGGRRNAGSRG